MERENLESQAKVIAERFGDLKGLGFYCLAVKRLGFDKCYELASLALLYSREGKIKKTPASFFNGCVMREVRDKGLTWRYKRDGN